MTSPEYKAETKIAEMLYNGELYIEQLSIYHQGTFKRNYSLDLIFSQNDIETQELTIFLNREGLYDMLPEGLFHEVKPNRNTKDYLRNSKRFREEEKAARRFFLPLEQEFFRQRLWLESIELHTTLNHVSLETETYYKNFWGLDEGMFTSKQCRTLLAILPHLNDLVGNVDAIAHCLEIIIELPVSVEMSDECETFESEDGFMLANTNLGSDSTLGSRWKWDEPVINVNIGPISSSRLIDFLPETEGDSILKKLYGYFFPVEAEVNTNVQIEEDAQHFALNREQPFSSILGFSTVI